MKQKIALLNLVQELTQSVQTLSKFIEKETEEEVNVRGMSLVNAINLDAAKLVIKQLSKGIDHCPFCDTNVRQITSHLKECKADAVDVLELFKPPEVVVKEVQVEAVVEDKGPPVMKLKCNICGEEVEGADETFYIGFWEQGLPCPKAGRCNGRLVSNMSPDELKRQKAYRNSKPRTASVG